MLIFQCLENQLNLHQLMFLIPSRLISFVLTFRICNLLSDKEIFCFLSLFLLPLPLLNCYYSHLNQPKNVSFMFFTLYFHPRSLRFHTQVCHMGLLTLSFHHFFHPCLSVLLFLHHYLVQFFFWNEKDHIQIYEPLIQYRLLFPHSLHQVVLSLLFYQHRT